MAESKFGLPLINDLSLQGRSIVDTVWEHQVTIGYAVGDLVTYQNVIYQCIQASDTSVKNDQIPTNTMYWGLIRGSTAVTTELVSSNGPILGEFITTTDLSANVSIGGVLQDDTLHGGYNYKWTLSSSGKTVCVSHDRQVLNNPSGSPLVSADGATCDIGVPADTTLQITLDTVVGGSLRTIIIGSEDIPHEIRLQCEVSNIT